MTPGKNYSAGAILFLKQIKEMRDHIEYEKFLCRTLIDDERTREMEIKTAAHPNKLYNLRYNSEKAKKITVAGKKNAN